MPGFWIIFRNRIWIYTTYKRLYKNAYCPNCAVCYILNCVLIKLVEFCALYFPSGGVFPEISLQWWSIRSLRLFVVNNIQSTTMKVSQLSSRSFSTLAWLILSLLTFISFDISHFEHLHLLWFIPFDTCNFWHYRFWHFSPLAFEHFLLLKFLTWIFLLFRFCQTLHLSLLTFANFIMFLWHLSLRSFRLAFVIRQLWHLTL